MTFVVTSVMTSSLASSDYQTGALRSGCESGRFRARIDGPKSTLALLTAHQRNIEALHSHSQVKE